MGTRARGLAAMALTVGLVVGAAACGSDSDGAGPATTRATADGATTATTTTLVPVDPTEVEVGLADYSFTIDKTLTAGPTRFVATNHGNEEHQMTLVKLKEGQTLADVIAVLQGDVAKGLESNTLVPGPQGVAPGATRSMTVDLEAGHYVALCAIPDSKGVPHAAMGMIAELEVVPADEPADGTAVPADPVVTLADYRFDLPEGFDGSKPIRVENVGSKPHELAIYRVNDGSTYDEAAAYLTADTPPGVDGPVTAMGGVTAMSPGQVAGVDLDLSSGTYVIVCFLPATDGKAHFQHGMNQKVDIP